ncbi:hypothetical protein, partial [Catenulispora pinisilvae]|uniref:hypothetical protein n=1 Tax=Catenulispora pinisilvae TaxID=2705253 RepID=UPI00189209DA
AKSCPRTPRVGQQIRGEHTGAEGQAVGEYVLVDAVDVLPSVDPAGDPGLLPDGRPQLRRRTPQGHISARLIQAEGQQNQHGTGALSPTMMSDFWQGLSAGTAPTDPPAAGPDPSQHDRTTANRQEWNQ